jgi:hypothetical protein
MSLDGRDASLANRRMDYAEEKSKLVVNSSEGWCIRPGPMEQSIYQCVSTINTGRIAATMVFGLQHSPDA